MSFGLSAVAVAEIGAAVAAAGTAYNAYSANQAGKRQNAANTQAATAAAKNQQMADEANNQANAKTPDVAAQLQANLAAGKQGAAGTMLTGPSGVDPTQLTLGQTSLLGG
jgi:hypothetical protein